ncbi:MAG: ATP-binding cassette domain-containing protein [Lachnospiraceae bacterium]|nr:ATP-binding cassette domain-containing protein [Lachnospiraceae bacterium]
MDIKLKNLSKSYGSEQVLSDFNYEFKDGSFTCIMGKSGAGKTTLLRILMGLEKPDGGVIEGVKESKLSAVFQENRLCENLTALLNVRIITDMSGKYSDSDIRRCFARIGIDTDAKKTVNEFSGGMKRRVAIVRALLADFDLLIMDEPLKGLDEETRNDVIELIKEYTRGKTVIMTTHDTDEPEAFGAEILDLK